MRKVFVLLLSVVLCLTLVVPGSQRKVAAQTPETIAFWMFGSEDPTTVGFLNGMKDKFKQQTGITVDWKIISWDDAQTRLMLAVTSGNAPDISMVGATWVGQFMATGAIMDLTPYLSQLGGAEAFVPGAWASAGRPGNLIAPPWDADTRAMIYRKDIFDQLRLTMPRTWDDWVAVARKIQQATGQRYPIAMPVKGLSPVYNLVWLTYLNGGDVISPDNKTALVSAPKTIQAATFMADLITKYKVMSPSVGNYSNLEVVNSFVNGETSMILAPIYYVYQAAEKPGSKVAGKWSFALPPTATPNIKQISMVLPDNLMIFKSTQHRDAALKFMAFLLDTPQEVNYATTFGLPPTTNAAFNSSEFSSPYWKLQYEIMTVGRFTPLAPGWGEAETSIGKAIANIMSAAVTGNVPQGLITSELQKANVEFQNGIDAAVGK